MLAELEKLRKKGVEGKKYTAWNHPVIGLKDVHVNAQGHIQYLTIGICSKVEAKSKNLIELKIPTLTPVVDQLWLRPSSCIAKTDKEYSQQYTLVIESGSPSTDDKQYFMIEFRAYWLSSITSQGSDAAKLSHIHLNAMKILFLRDELKEVRIEANLMPNMAINGTRIIDVKSQRCLRLTRVEDFSFETEAVLGHYRAIGNVREHANLDGLYVVVHLTEMFEQTL